MKVKRVPLRLCLGCMEMKPKKELIRVVRTPEGAIEIDPTGKKSGRGAYICPTEGCLSSAIKGKRLEKSLKTKIEEELIQRLKEGLPG